MCARILIVDDDPVNLDLMAYLLTAFGHDSVPTENAACGLEEVRKGGVALILCDIQMPAVDGFEFVRRLNTEALHTVPVVGVTAMAMVGDREKILAAGFDGYLAKPIVPETFIQDIEQHLPAADRTLQKVSMPAFPSSDELPAPSFERKSLRVLVVDDQPSNVDLLRVLLEHYGYDVLPAVSGNAALRIARSESPDAIVSDVHMPDGNGFELLEALQHDPQLARIPLILVTALSHTFRDVERGLALGASRFLVRPFEPEVLVDALSTCIQRAQKIQ